MRNFQALAAERAEAASFHLLYVGRPGARAAAVLEARGAWAASSGLLTHRSVPRTTRPSSKSSSGKGCARRNGAVAS